MKSLIRLLSAVPFRLVYVAVGVEGFPDAYTPELWAEEGVAILEENMVAANLVHRDFEDKIQSYGDTVNTRKPGELEANFKTSADEVTVQTPTATSIPVVLNRHMETTFMIKDADQSKSFKDLVVEYLQPAMLAMARKLDLIVLSQVFQFLVNTSGQVDQLSGSNADAYLLACRLKLNQNKAYVDDRNLILTTVSETALLSDPKFTDANRVGDDGTALRKASLGQKYGFDIFMAQNTPYSLAASTDKVTGAINNGSGYAVGIKTFTVDNFSAAITAGSWISIAGDNTPLQVVSTVGAGTPTSITTVQGLKTAVVNDAAVYVWGVGQVNNVGGYAADWPKKIVYDTFTLDPQVGQGLTFGTGTSGAIYGIIGVDTTAKTITLDRPLEAAIADDAKINLLPAGSYNWAFHRNAIALVCRPLALPMSGTGARSGEAEYNGLKMRVVFSYDARKQGTMVTVDMLLGIKLLDINLGAQMLG